jgi:rfaE bifunctional protein kinase chain/domain
MRRSHPAGGLAELAGLLERFPRAEVVLAGDLVADEYLYGETERISREAPVLIVRYESSELKPGCAGNAALNLAALGVKVRAVGAVGADDLGDGLLRALARGGVDVGAVQRVRGRATESKTRILAGGRSTRRQQMLRVDRAPPEPLPPRIQARVAAAVERLGRRAGAVLASDYGSATLSQSAVEALRRVRRAGVPVCADSRYRLPAFAGLTMCKPNEPELEAAAGLPVKALGELERAGRALRRRLACEQLLVTRGHNGMSLFRAGLPPIHVAAHGGAEAVDVTGAGDAVGASYAAALAAGADPVAAMRIANVAGALAVRKPGTVPVAHGELLGELFRG